MEKIGKFPYPNLRSFKDALLITKKAIDYDGSIAYVPVAKEFKHSVKDPQRISGRIYQEFDDLCVFGTLTRNKGTLEITELADKALDPTNPARASKGKAEAILKVAIIEKAYNNWKGEIPEEPDFIAKLSNLASVSWIEAKNHAESLRKLFMETFSYLRADEGLPPLVPTGGPKAKEKVETPEVPTSPASPTLDIRVGEIFIRIPKNKKALAKVRKLLDLFEDEIEGERGKKK